MINFICMGDPHLGKRFKTGVPLHRIGDREQLVWDQFKAELMQATPGLHIMLGDLFDKFIVPPEVVLFAADTYLQAVAANPNTTYVVLKGNHDGSRDQSTSSFDLFTRLVSGHVVVIDQPCVIKNYGFIPYDHFQTATDQVLQLPEGLARIFTHLDYADWGGDHVIPTELLATRGITKVTNGHDHLCRVESRHGVEVTMHGSLQPYSHDQDADGTWYRTLSLADLEGLDTSRLNLRVLLEDGDVLPVGVDCLSLTGKRVKAEDTSLEVDTTEFNGFDMEAEITAVVDPSILEELLGVFKS
jgi:DNA repair exonuclease SbcCD nuclease subunit